MSEYKIGVSSVRVVKDKVVKDGIEEVVRHRYGIASCLCGTVKLQGKLGSFENPSTQVTCEGCGNTTFIRTNGREIHPYLEVLEKSRLGFKVKRTNLSVWHDEDYNVFVKPNMIQVLVYDLANHKIHLYKNGETRKLYPSYYEEGIRSFFTNLNHYQFKQSVETPETKMLYDFAWADLSLGDRRRWNAERKFYKGMIKLFDYTYLEILSNAGFTNIDRFKGGTGYYGYQHVINKKGKNPKEILGVPKFFLKYIRENDNLTLREIGLMQSAMKKVDGNRFRELLEIVKDESTIATLCNTLDTLIEIHDKYKYNNLKKLTLYLFREIRMNQGISSPNNGATLLRDYLRMATVLNYEYEKYPKSLKKDHDVMTMNYKVQESDLKKREFQIAVESDYYKANEYVKKKEFAVIAPKEMQDLIKEGNELSHCVASYVDSILTQRCQIYFLRDPEQLEEPVATIEVRGGNVRQARGYANRRLTDKEKAFVAEWAEKKKLELNYYY